MSIESLTQQAAEAGAWRRENPEGISVLVVTQDRAMAEAVAPLLAERLHPERAIGPVLHVGDVEPLVEVQGIEVVVQDWGPKWPVGR